jgi:dTDP-glucose 4,6-dehydratase
MAVISFANTYRLPCIITNTMNIYGERQHPEKYVPLVINKILKGEKLYIHANKERTQAGKRHYLHARNISAATLWVIQNGKPLDGSATQGRYNIVGEVEMDNLELAKLIEKYVHEWQTDAAFGNVRYCEPLNYELVDFHSSRPGHDLRYALDGTHLAEAGFSYPVSFHDSLRKTVRWTLDHRSEWL